MTDTIKECFLKYNILITVITAWALAQGIKTILYYIIEGEFRAERLVGSGGMPSSHSSTVCALAVTAIYTYGFNSFEFAISVVLAIIVMHDAMGVRLETGKQARVLNAILNEKSFALIGEAFEQDLKEFVGHTPSQVIAGAILGILVGLTMQLVYLAVI